MFAVFAVVSQKSVIILIFLYKEYGGHRGCVLERDHKNDIVSRRTSAVLCVDPYIVV